MLIQRHGWSEPNPINSRCFSIVESLQVILLNGFYPNSLRPTCSKHFLDRKYHSSHFPQQSSTPAEILDSKMLRADFLHQFELHFFDAPTQTRLQQTLNKSRPFNRTAAFRLPSFQPYVYGVACTAYSRLEKSIINYKPQCGKWAPALFPMRFGVGFWRVPGRLCGLRVGSSRGWRFHWSVAFWALFYCVAHSCPNAIGDSPLHRALSSPLSSCW